MRPKSKPKRRSDGRVYPLFPVQVDWSKWGDEPYKPLDQQYAYQWQTGRGRWSPRVGVAARMQSTRKMRH